MSELKPCPMCGDQPMVETLGTHVTIYCCVSMSTQKGDLLTRNQRETWSNDLMSFGAGAEAIVMNQVVKEWNFRPAEEEMQTEIEQLDSDNMQLDAEIERLEKVEAAAKDIYFAGQWVMICGSKTKDKPLWDALKEATGWSVSGGSK